MMTKSIKRNAILNVIRVLSTAVFPLITYPYATRVLGVDNIGKVQFGLSIVSYFTLIAALGTSVYGAREGAYVRKDSTKFSQLANEIFTLNIFSTITSYALLIMTLVCLPPLAPYKLLILIQGLVIFFNTISVDWLYTAQEDFFYITIRSVAVQIISLIMLFIFVKNENDYYIYALINVVATAGTGIFNFLHTKKYCKLRPIFSLSPLHRHVKPLLILFTSAIAIQIYINSDVTMLGLLVDDRSVGLYTVPMKVYSIVKNLLNAAIAVSIPRFAFYVANKSQKKFNTLGSKVIQLCIVLALPATVLLALLSKNIIFILSGAEFLDGAMSLSILSISLMFAVASNFLGNAVLVTWKHEKNFLIATVSGALINIILNLLFIPLWEQNGAAITTFLSELAVMLICGYTARKFYKGRGTVITLFQSILSCFSIVITYFIVHQFNLGYFAELAIVACIGSCTYMVTMLCFKNPSATEITQRVAAIIKKLSLRHSVNTQKT